MNTTDTPTNHTPCDPTTLQALLARVERLETQSLKCRRDTRRWRSATLATVALAVTFMSLAATQSSRTPEVIRARRFEVVDQSDKIVLLMGIGQNGGQVDVWSSAGANVLRLGASAEGGDIALWNAKLQPVAAMYATAQGGRIEATMPDASGAAVLRAEGSGPAMAITDSEDRPRIVATSAPSTTGFSVRNAEGQELIALGASEGHGGIIRVSQPDGTIAAQMLAYDSGGLVECASRTGARAAILGVAGAEVGGSLTLFSPDGAEALSAQAKADSGSRLTLLDATKQPAVVVESGAENTALVSLWNNGKRVAGLGSSESGGLLNLAKADGRAVVVAGPASDADGGAVSIRGGTGSQLVRLGVDRVGAGEVAVYDGPGTRKRVLNATSAQP
ncbi:MAG: hypothetical protein EXS03_04085 [Phycisphaerales bacterium]|nr:hypothetical protein [Phycisphaerales bacterium]